MGYASVLWKEGFEDAEEPWDRWHVEDGLWAVGTPSSGPKRAFTGANCAATVLHGDYPPGADARLVRDRTFTVPPASEQPRLRFWHWFQGGAGSSRAVEIKVGAGPWQAITAASGWESEDWARASFDLSPFSGQSVQVAFHFQSGTELEVGPGWYVDEVAIEIGPTDSDFINAPEGFEAGLGNWTIDRGVWEVGPPTAGPTRAFGTNCVGTVLNGLYQPGADSRLISPEFVVPLASENPRLRFWQWFSIYAGDPARVEISVGGGAWVSLAGPFEGNSPWTRPSIDLRPFAGQLAQISFHFQSDPDYNIAYGWYIDEVTIETGPVDWDPTNAPETFESGLGAWSADHGVWEVGAPTTGPGGAHGGSQCAGTVLGGNYSAHSDSRLISPEFVVPAATERPRLRFWHWLKNKAGDPGTVEIRTSGGEWKDLSGGMVANDGTWARPYLSLAAFAGERVQVAFHFQANDDADVAAGWFIDEVAVETGPDGPSLVNHIETFDAGLGDWSVDKGSWEVGQPDTWPDQVISGVNCVGTVLAGTYSPDVNSRLISPEFELPAAAENPRLRFWHWFSMFPADPGTVEISVAGGDWQALSQPFSGNGVVWSRPWIDLKPFAGQRVRIAFHFQSNSDDDVARGWYLDDIVVETGSIGLETFNQAEGFESGIGNWSVENGTWEVGAAVSAPGGTFKGTNCIATVLRFNYGQYAPKTDSRLVSPPFTVPCADAAPALRFVQWYSISAGDQGDVEVRVAGGDWEELLGPIGGSSQGWIAAYADLAAYAGKTIQIGFRFRSNEDEDISYGWYLDEIKFQANALQMVGETSVTEGNLLTYSFGSPCQNLRFALGAGAPTGMSIDPVQGFLVWLPSEEEGPGVYPVQVCVTDITQPSGAVECVNLEIAVLENNEAPALDPIESQTIQANVPLEFIVTGYDRDRPAQNLRFSLDQGAPFGASINPDTGLFSWTPTPTQATAASVITLRVTDDGDPPKSGTTSFTVTPKEGVSEVHLRIARLTPELINVCIAGGTMGAIYKLETCTEFQAGSSSTAWTELQTFWKGEDDACETTHSTVNVARYYRVRRVQ